MSGTDPKCPSLPQMSGNAPKYQAMPDNVRPCIKMSDLAPKCQALSQIAGLAPNAMQCPKTSGLAPTCQALPNNIRVALGPLGHGSWALGTTPDGPMGVGPWALYWALGLLPLVFIRCGIIRLILCLFIRGGSVQNDFCRLHFLCLPSIFLTWLAWLALACLACFNISQA